jgi:NAD(P)-dependent dehydrogenase (short-subunit alcohol dehydrogenase family)
MLAAMSPMGRVGAARDIANAILFLAGDESAFITGEEIVVDGGHVVASWPQPSAPSA